MQKVFNNGEIWFLHNEDGSPTEYEIIDSGIYLTEYGKWDTLIIFRNKNNNEKNHTPLWMLESLIYTGQMFKKSQEKMAEALRKVYDDQQNGPPKT
jgi:hypothetical protein